MKRTYIKPQIAFDSLALSSNIAAGCELKTDTFSFGDCAYMSDAWRVPIFTTSVVACKKQFDELPDGDSNACGNVCYHVSVLGANNVFRS